jgi:hypothetical protein
VNQNTNSILTISLRPAINNSTALDVRRVIVNNLLLDLNRLKILQIKIKNPQKLSPPLATLAEVVVENLFWTHVH